MALGRRLIDAGPKPSMGSADDAYESATAKSFFPTLESKLLARYDFEPRDQARREFL